MNDHRLLHRATFFYTAMQRSRSNIMEKPHDLLLDGGFCSKGIAVEVCTSSGVTPSCGLAKKSRVQGCTSSFEKNTPLRQKWGSPVVGQPGRHCRHTHSVCRLISRIPSRPPVTLNVPAYKHLKGRYNWGAKPRTVRLAATAIRIQVTRRGPWSRLA